MPPPSTACRRFLPLLALLAAGCGRGNGLAGDLEGLLSGRGIAIAVRGSEAPLSSRAGYVFIEGDPALEARIVSAFGLAKIEPGDRRFEFAASKVPARPKAVWGIGGRPACLRLGDGGQFEHLYLLTTAEGRTYLVSEYAYG